MDRMTMLKSQWDRAFAVGTAIAGVIVLIVGWVGVSGTPYPAAQLPYIISAGVGGMFLLGISTALWLSADLRDEWRKLDRIEQAIRAGGWVADEPPAEFTQAPERTDRTPVSTPKAAR